jgi:hypothetical protein
MLSGSNATFQRGWRGCREADVAGRRAASICHHDQDRTLLRCNRPRAQQAVTSRYLELWVAYHVKCRRRVLGRYRDLHWKVPGIDRAGWPHPQLDILGLAGIDRDGTEFLAAIGLGE